MKREGGKKHLLKANKCVENLNPVISTGVGFFHLYFFLLIYLWKQTTVYFEHQRPMYVQPRFNLSNYQRDRGFAGYKLEHKENWMTLQIPL